MTGRWSLRSVSAPPKGQFFPGPPGPNLHFCNHRVRKRGSTLLPYVRDGLHHVGP